MHCHFLWNLLFTTCVKNNSRHVHIRSDSIRNNVHCNSSNRSANRRKCMRACDLCAGIVKKAYIFVVPSFLFFIALILCVLQTIHYFYMTFYNVPNWQGTQNPLNQVKRMKRKAKNEKTRFTPNKFDARYLSVCLSVWVMQKRHILWSSFFSSHCCAWKTERKGEGINGIHFDSFIIDT